MSWPIFIIIPTVCLYLLLFIFTSRFYVPGILLSWRCLNCRHLLHMYCIFGGRVVIEKKRTCYRACQRPIHVSRHANSSESQKTSSAISYNYKIFNCVVDVKKETQSYLLLNKTSTENILIVIVPAFVKTT